MFLLLLRLAPLTVPTCFQTIQLRPCPGQHTQLKLAVEEAAGPLPGPPAALPAGTRDTRTTRKSKDTNDHSPIGSERTGGTKPLEAEGLLSFNHNHHPAAKWACSVASSSFQSFQREHCRPRKTVRPPNPGCATLPSSVRRRKRRLRPNTKPDPA